MGAQFLQLFHDLGGGQALGRQTGSLLDQNGQTVGDLLGIIDGDGGGKTLFFQQLHRAAGGVAGTGHLAGQAQAEQLGAARCGGRRAERLHVLVQIGMGGFGQLLTIGQAAVQGGRVDFDIVAVLFVGTEGDAVRNGGDAQFLYLPWSEIADRIGQNMYHPRRSFL